MIIIAFLLLLGFIFHHPKIKGKIGEIYVTIFLKRLPENKYRVINDLLLAKNGHSTQIDHVIVSIYGIFVVETKFYKGWIFGGENSEYWTQNIYGRKYKLLNPIYQNQGHIRALKSLLQGYEHLPFISIVAFSRRATLRVKTETSVIYYHQIPRVIKRTQNEVVSEEEVKQIHSILLANNTEKRVVKRRHIANVKRNALRRNRAVANGYCPRCGGVLTQRKGKYGKFYGCSNYPRCKYMTKKL